MARENWRRLRASRDADKEPYFELALASAPFSRPTGWPLPSADERPTTSRTSRCRRRCLRRRNIGERESLGTGAKVATRPNRLLGEI